MKFFGLILPLIIVVELFSYAKNVDAEVGRPASAKSAPEFVAHQRKDIEKKKQNSQVNKLKIVSGKNKTVKNKKTTSSRKKANTSKKSFKPRLYIDKIRYTPGEKMNVSFKASKRYGENAWLGIVPSNIKHGKAEENDLHAISYQYLDKKTKGSMSFQAPLKYGKYDIRMHDSELGKEVAYVSFTVKESSGSLELNKKKYKTGEAIKVKFNAPKRFKKDAWVGLMRSSVPHNDVKLNDKHDLEKYTIDNRINGIMVFTVYLYKGEYDLRMFDSKDGSEVASVSFIIE